MSLYRGLNDSYYICFTLMKETVIMYKSFAKSKIGNGGITEGKQ